MINESTLKTGRHYLMDIVKMENKKVRGKIFMRCWEMFLIWAITGRG
jgi:hypothetical protein